MRKTAKEFNKHNQETDSAVSPNPLNKGTVREESRPDELSARIDMIEDDENFCINCGFTKEIHEDEESLFPNCKSFWAYQPESIKRGMKEALEAVEKKLMDTDGTTYKIPNSIVQDFTQGFIQGHKIARDELKKTISAWKEELK